MHRRQPQVATCGLLFLFFVILYYSSILVFSFSVQEEKSTYFHAFFKTVETTGFVDLQAFFRIISDIELIIFLFRVQFSLIN